MTTAVCAPSSHFLRPASTGKRATTSGLRAHAARALNRPPPLAPIADSCCLQCATREQAARLDAAARPTAGTQAWPGRIPGRGRQGSVPQRALRRSEHMTASPGIPQAGIVSSGRTRDGVTILPPRPPRRVAAVDHALWARVTRHAKCAASGLDPDRWFPVSVDPAGARLEAAVAIAVCTGLPGPGRVPGAVAAALGHRPARCVGRAGRKRPHASAPQADRRPQRTRRDGGCRGRGSEGISRALRRLVKDADAR